MRSSSCLRSFSFRIRQWFAPMQSDARCSVCSSATEASGVADGVAGGAIAGRAIAARDLAQNVAGNGNVSRARRRDRPSRLRGAASSSNDRFLFVMGTLPLVLAWLASPSIASALSRPAILGEVQSYRRRASCIAAVREAALDLLREVRNRRNPMACPG